jgi:hypothetical protein
MDAARGDQLNNSGAADTSVDNAAAGDVSGHEGHEGQGGGEEDDDEANTSGHGGGGGDSAFDLERMLHPKLWGEASENIFYASDLMGGETAGDDAPMHVTGGGGGAGGQPSSSSSSAPTLPGVRTSMPRANSGSAPALVRYDVMCKNCATSRLA